MAEDPAFQLRRLTAMQTVVAGVPDNTEDERRIAETIRLQREADELNDPDS